MLSGAARPDEGGEHLARLERASKGDLGGGEEPLGLEVGQAASDDLGDERVAPTGTGSWEPRPR
jgi:hypothetical protein